MTQPSYSQWAHMKEEIDLKCEQDWENYMEELEDLDYAQHLIEEKKKYKAVYRKNRSHKK